MKDSRYFNKSEVARFIAENVTDAKINLTKIATQNDWIIPNTQNWTIKYGELERKLLSATNHKHIKKCLVDLAKMQHIPSAAPLWKINGNWTISPEIRVTVLSFKPGFLQDFSYILLGKSNEQLQRKDYATSVNLLNDLLVELRRPDWSSDQLVIKLMKQIEWEKNNIELLNRFDSFWPNKPILVKDMWTVKLKQMMNGMMADMPRLEIIENCLLMMINANDWNACMFSDIKLSPIVEMCSVFASMMMDIQSDKNKNQMPRKRDFWDMILPIFSNQNQNTNSKRNHNDRRSNDSPARFNGSLLNVSNFKQLIEKLRDPLVISIFLSMLSKMHNLLKDDTNMELNIENFHLWPMSISNVNGYNIKSLSEVLNHLLRQSLKLYPLNIPWVKLQGDLEYVNGNNESAMKFYVQSIVIATEHCTLPVARPLIDENVIKKMIKCTSNIGCYLQSVVLCQFMEEIDYSMAFKCLQEKSSNSQDAMDSYYSLIWDSTLLEYIINLHNKKGEHKRRLTAISFIRQLELNSNNNEEVKQRAAAIRKTRFIRALANQYM